MFLRHGARLPAAARLVRPCRCHFPCYRPQVPPLPFGAFPTRPRGQPQRRPADFPSPDPQWTHLWRQRNEARRAARAGALSPPARVGEAGAVRRTGRARRRRPPGEVAVCQMTPPRHSTKRAFARSAGSCRRLSFRGPTERAASAPKGGDARARPAPARGRAPGPWRSGGPQVSAAPGTRPAAQCHARFARRRATLGFLHVAFLTDAEGLGVQGPAAGAPRPLR